MGIEKRPPFYKAYSSRSKLARKFNLVSFETSWSDLSVHNKFDQLAKSEFVTYDRIKSRSRELFGHNFWFDQPNWLDFILHERFNQDLSYDTKISPLACLFPELFISLTNWWPFFTGNRWWYFYDLAPHFHGFLRFLHFFLV